MLGSSSSLILALAFVSQSLARFVDIDYVGEKRDVPLLKCDKFVDSQNLQMVYLNHLETRDIDDSVMQMDLPNARSSKTEAMEPSVVGPGILLGTRDLLKRAKDIQESQTAPFLGYSGDTYKGANVFGGSNSSTNLIFEFYECDNSDFMGYKSYTTSDGTKFQYGHVKVADTGKCLQAAKLAARNQKLIENECPESEDSSQFASFFEFRSRVKRDANDPMMTSTLRSLKFLGKPKGNLYGIKGEYKTLYNSDNKLVRIDYRKEGDNGQDQREIAFIMPMKRSGK